MIDVSPESAEVPTAPATRPPVRQYLALIVIGAATAQALGMTLKMPTQLEANDISRWCTVWSLLEKHTYAIDDCPWQSKTQDKVFKAAPFQKLAPGQAPVKHYYSSKPPLLPTMIAGILYPFRTYLGVPLDKVYEEDRFERYVPIEDKTAPNGLRYVLQKPKVPGLDLRLMSWGDSSGVPTSGRNLAIVGTDNKGLLHIRIFDGRGERVTDADETQLPDQAAAIASLKQQLPGFLPPHVLTDSEKARMIGEAASIVGRTVEPLKWPVFVFYLKPIIVLVNVVPMLVFLVLYARFLDRYAANDWAWCFALVAGAWGTYLIVFDQTLNNHTVAAYSAFFALYAFLRIWDDGAGPFAFAAAGFFAAFCACNELPGALFGVLFFLMLLARFPRRTLLFFVPAAAIPCAAFLATQYAAFGTFRPVYEEFGTESYNYAGSYWNTPLEMDYLNKEPEPKPVYLFHMTFGHHGIWSLSPIFLLSLYGMLLCLFSARARGVRPLAWLTLILTAGMLAFYTWNPKARNYGGSTQGLRWLFWLIPFWLLMLPPALESGGRSRFARVVATLALMLSVFSVGYAVRSPWSHPWIQDMLEHLNLYNLRH
jgi:hypothetical protein